MPQLPPEWVDHLQSGSSLRVGSSHADGQPEICRALAAQALPDGQVELVLNRATAQELLAAAAASRRVACVASQPDTNRTLNLRGGDAAVVQAESRHAALVDSQRDRFVQRVAPFGFRPEVISSFWFEVPPDQLVVLRFTLAGAWDQSPGPGAGQAIELLP